MKTVLVTGATSRLGAELSRSFARDQYRVLLHANSSYRRLQELSNELNGEGYDTLSFECDFRLNEKVEQFLIRIFDAAGVPDIIVNNASVFKYDAPGSVVMANLQESLQVHVLAPALITEFAVRRKRHDQALCIFNILDQKLLNMNPDYFSYTVGKAGLHAVGELWQGMEKSGVRVFGILPGLLFPSGAQRKDRYLADIKKSPLPGPVTPQDIYHAMSFFVHNEGIKSQDLTIDCGESLTGRMRDVAFE